MYCVQVKALSVLTFATNRAKPHAAADKQPVTRARQRPGACVCLGSGWDHHHLPLANVWRLCTKIRKGMYQKFSRQICIIRRNWSHIVPWRHGTTVYYGYKCQNAFPSQLQEVMAVKMIIERFYEITNDVGKCVCFIIASSSSARFANLWVCSQQVHSARLQCNQRNYVYDVKFFS